MIRISYSISEHVFLEKYKNLLIKHDIDFKLVRYIEYINSESWILSANTPNVYGRLELTFQYNSLLSNYHVYEVDTRVQ